MNETPVNGCSYCGLPDRGTPDYPLPHAQRWVSPLGWHVWTPPTQPQIKERMIARRAARIFAKEAR